MTSPSISINTSQSATHKRGLSLPAWLVLICLITFSILLGAGAAIWKNAPPVPATVVSPQQTVIFTQAEIQSGQEIYLARGGQHIGSVWGHGSYLAPDWTADFLHKWGLNTTPIHAHSALFGVYGSLALALMLFALREITPDQAWSDRLLNFAFWHINGGLVIMMVFGLIPNGFYQLVQSVNHGTWYARSAEVIHSPWMQWTV